MLVLAAAYRNKRLRHLVSQDKLLTLLDRTISALGRLGAISQTCQADYWILRRCRQWLFQDVDLDSTVNGIVASTSKASRG